jgi:outer membrane protein W
MKFGRMLVLSLATLLIAVPAVYAQDDMGDMVTKKPARKMTQAEEENADPSRPGPMLGLGGTYAHANFDTSGQDERDSGGYNAHVGYRFNRWVAAVVHVERYQKFNLDDSAGSDVGEVNGWALGLDAKVFALPGRIQPFGLIGLNYLSMETTNKAAPGPAFNTSKTDDGPALRFGVGVDLFATQKIVATTDVSYMLGLSDVHDFDMVLVSLGFSYRP